METKTTTLERPRAVQMAAAVLIMAPVLDMMMSQRTGAQVFSVFSWILIFGAGVSLLVRHKSSWVLGIILCSVFVISTGVSLVREMDTVDPIVSSAKLLDCLLVIFIVGTVSYFFRYPYLDRRQNWFAPTGDRFAIVSSVVLGGAETQTIDLSYTGARITIPGSATFKSGDVVALQLTEINDISCKARVVDVKEDHIRVHFEGTSASEKDLIRQWLNSQDLKKV
ncbi:PilZ domain-containing protein [uncultured Bdellovibrio sp.]|uniref:PilZ domain-containing protein n=1 Tax=Bdellovibrio sp. HCB-162 TaxID=3394234 RepID=UPI0025DADC29|nr:PilZ domain-containing protein [uncultured Bdellovibrio sp.]